MRNILIVEDEPLIYDVFKAEFDARGGYDLAYAADGELALAALARHQPDLAIIDVKLPKVSGIRVAEHAATQAVPVILMSGHPDVVANPKLPFPIVVKPFRVGALAEQIDQLLAEAKALQDELARNVRLSQDMRLQLEGLRLSPAEALSEHWLLVCHRLLGNISAAG